MDPKKSLSSIIFLTWPPTLGWWGRSDTRILSKAAIESDWAARLVVSIIIIIFLLFYYHGWDHNPSSSPSGDNSVEDRSNDDDFIRNWNIVSFLLCVYRVLFTPVLCTLCKLSLFLVGYKKKNKLSSQCKCLYCESLKAIRIDFCQQSPLLSKKYFSWKSLTPEKLYG